MFPDIFLYGRASFISVLFWIRGEKHEHEVEVTGEIPKAWILFCERFRIQIDQHDLGKWVREIFEDEFRKEGIAVSRSHHKKRGMVLPRYETGRLSKFRQELIRMRAQQRLRKRQQDLILQKTDVSRIAFYLTISVFRIYLFFSEPFFRLRGISVADLGVLQQVNQAITESTLQGESLSGVFKIVAQKWLSGYFILLKRRGCCWEVWGRKEVMKRGFELVAVIKSLRDIELIHQLHCQRAREEGYLTRKGQLAGDWSQKMEKVGDPFGQHQFTNSPKSLGRCIYTFEQLKELGELIAHGQLSRKFVRESVRCGVFLAPADYVRLNQVVGEMNPDGLQKAAWLHHSNVRLNDIPLCAGFLQYTNIFQARQLAKDGVLPELLEALGEENMLSKLTPDRIILIHRLCEAEGTDERVMQFLKLGIKPEQVKWALQLRNEFPEKLLKDIGEAVKESRTLQEAQNRLGGQIPESHTRPSKTPRYVHLRPSGREKKEKGFPLPEEVPSVSPAPVTSLRVSPSLIPWGITQKKLTGALRRDGWVRVVARGRGHVVFGKGIRRIYFSGTHGAKKGGLNRYTLADVFSQAGFSPEEVNKVLRG